MSELYRSNNTPQGYFSRPGCLHLHIEGILDRTVAVEVAQRLEDHGARGKVNVVMGSIEGPQRRTLAAAYAGHTPGTTGDDTIYFCTAEVTNRGHALLIIKDILADTTLNTGAVVELEYVAKLISGDTTCYAPSQEEPRSVSVKEIPGVLETPSIEIHHAIDVISGETDPPLTLRQLLAASKKMNFQVGGWLVRGTNEGWAYRSSEFSHDTDSARTQHDLLYELLGMQVHRIRTIEERILGVWKIP